MNKVVLGVLLILIMFGHNYVLNQPQVLQSQFQQIHKVTVTQFNLLYSLPSAIAIFFIIPLGVLYDKHGEYILVGSGLFLAFGQFLVYAFGTNPNSYAFPLVTIGRIFEGTTAQVLYMIQANLSSSWMGKLAGLTLILPEIGQIANVFLTLEIRQTLGMSTSLFIGFISCLFSFVACLFLYRQIKRHKKLYQLHAGSIKVMVNSPQIKDQNDKELTVLDSNTDSASIGEKSALEIKPKNQKPTGSLQINSQSLKDCSSIFKAGQVFWLVVVLCAVNQCLYFPFLDNAKILIQTRFCITQQKTSFYLCLPYLSAITLSILVGEHILYKFPRHKLIFVSSLLPLIGHTIIFFIQNCDQQTSYLQEILLITGFVFFGMGIAGYYSVSMPAIGLAVPQTIRGTAFAMLGFCQTLTMTAVPLISGQIIQQDQSNNDNYVQGYRNSSFFFVFLCLTASAISFMIMIKATPESFKYVDQQEQAQQQQLKKLQREGKQLVIQ